jgi:hypothetical protein
MASSSKQQKMIDCMFQIVDKERCNSRIGSSFQGDEDAQPRKKTNGFHNLETTCWKTMKTISNNFDSREGNQARRQQGG